jgi:hypothetical protein
MNRLYYERTPERNHKRRSFLTTRKKLVDGITAPLLKDGCVDCGVFYPFAMDFDHVTGEKFTEVSEVHSLKCSTEEMISLLKLELEKCQVRCANCHRIKTGERQILNSRLLFLKNPRAIRPKQRYIFEKLSQSHCIDCLNNDFRVLEYDHVRGIKIMEVSRMVKGSLWTYTDIDNEITKCDVRCVNCHRNKTWLRRIGEEPNIQETKYIPQADEKLCKCGAPKKFGNAGCLSCSRKPKIDWPTLDELCDMLNDKSFLESGKILGVSGNAIRKKLRLAGIDPKSFVRRKLS